MAVWHKAAGSFRKRAAQRKGRSLQQTPEIIGIAGSGPSVGVTHMAILTANYCAGVLNQRTAVLEWNESGDFGGLERILSKKAVTDSRSGSFNIMGAFYYKKAGKDELLGCAASGFNAIVIDFGTFRSEIQDEFLRCDRRFLVGSVSEWKLDAFAGLASQTGTDRRGWEFFSAFGSREALKMTEKLLGIRIRRIPIAGSAFAITEDILDFFGTFLG